MDLTAKRKRKRLTDEASKFRFVCKPFPFFVSSNFPSVACFRCRMPQMRVADRGKVFGLNTLRRRKILPETALPPDLAAAIKSHATFASVHREQVADGMNINYTIGCFPCHKRRAMLLDSLFGWRRSRLLQTV